MSKTGRRNNWLLEREKGRERVLCENLDLRFLHFHFKRGSILVPRLSVSKTSRRNNWRERGRVFCERLDLRFQRQR